MAQQSKKPRSVAAAAVSPPQLPGGEDSAPLDGDAVSLPGSEAFSPQNSRQSKRHSIDLSLSGASASSEGVSDEEELVEDSLDASRLDKTESQSDAPTPLLAEIGSPGPREQLSKSNIGTVHTAQVRDVSTVSLVLSPGFARHALAPGDYGPSTSPTQKIAPSVGVALMQVSTVAARSKFSSADEFA